MVPTFHCPIPQSLSIGEKPMPCKPAGFGLKGACLGADVYQQGQHCRQEEIQ
jgi:hypothetical protein